MSRPVRVVLADDTQDMRQLLSTLLEATGRFQIIGEAVDGREAVSLTERLKPDVVVLDLAMPVLDGLEATPQIRASSPGTVIVVLSGFDTKRVAEAALAAGADRYIEKGTAISHLARAIDEAMAARPQSPPSVAPAPPAERPAAAVDAHAGAYLARVAHELRTPLTVLAGAVRTLEIRWHEMTDADRGHLIAMLRRATDRMSELVDDVGEVAQMDAGELRTDQEVFDLVAVIDRAVDEARRTFPARAYTVSAPGQLPVAGDARRQEQILTTLLAHAAACSEDDAPIEVLAARSNGDVRVSVVDHGPGLGDEESGEAFSRFAQPANGARSGSGLGLTIARSLVEAQHGSIEVRRSPGVGSTFTYTVPAATARENLAS